MSRESTRSKGENVTTGDRTPRRLIRRVLVAGALAAASFAALGAGADRAMAAPCPSGLQVGGFAPENAPTQTQARRQAPPIIPPRPTQSPLQGSLPVTGTDCTTKADGSVDIRAPRLGSGGVHLTTPGGNTVTMTLSRDRLTLSTAGTVRVNAGSNAAILGRVSVRNVRFCDLGLPGPPPPLSGPGGGAAPASSEEIDAVEVNCRNLVGLRVEQPDIPFERTLGGLGVTVPKLKPLILAVDNLEGGRVLGAYALNLPEPLERIRVAVGAKVSASGGLGLTQAGVQLRTPITIAGAVVLKDVGLLFNAQNNTFQANGTLQIVPAVSIRGDLLIAGGRLQRLGADLTFTPPIPVFAAPPISLQRIDVRFQGSQGSTPASLTGALRFFAGPEVLGKPALSGDVIATIGGGRFRLTGDVFAIDRKVKLGSARALLESGRFELDANAEVLNGLLVGRVFVGITDDAFTGEGSVRFRFPDGVPFIGGETVGGVQGLVSDIGVAGMTCVDIPLAPDFCGGARFRWSNSDFDLFAGDEEFDAFRTVTASAALALRAGGAARASGALRFPPRLGAVLLEVRGLNRPPRGVVIRTPTGRVVTPRPLRRGRSLLYGLRSPAPGRWRVTSRDPIEVTASEERFPFLDPDPGWGSRPRRPVRAGTPVRVCWTLKNARSGARVDLFEDQNGHLGNGRLIARGLRPNACHRVPTAGMAPGRHWVYGVVTLRGLPLTSRYWPIAVAVRAGRGAPAPPILTKARPTRDGASVRFRANPATAALVRVRAEPAQAGDIEPVETDVRINPDRGRRASRTATISLRGTRTWIVRAQAIGRDGRPGNFGLPVTVRPDKPPVVAGRPGGVALVGRRWLFQLETTRTTRLRLRSGPPGLALSGRGLLRWTPTPRAGRRAPTPIVVEGCTADRRCVKRRFAVAAIPRGTLPFAPSRGFELLPNAVRRGELRAGAARLRIKAHGIDQRAVVRIDGRRVRAIRLGDATLELRLPRRLRVGPHDVSLRIGRDREELHRRVLTVYQR